MRSGCKNLRMRKKTLFDIVNQLEFLIHKQDKKILLIILVEVQVAYVLYKLVEGCNILIYSELFIINQSNVSFIVKEVKSQ